VLVDEHFVEGLRRWGSRSTEKARYESVVPTR
jgi:hypothetical protein